MWHAGSTCRRPRSGAGSRTASCRSATAAGRRRRSPTRASSPACASAATRSTSCARRRAPAGSPTATSRTCSRSPPARCTLEEAAEETGLEPALIERIWTHRRLLVGLARADRRGGPAAPALHGRGARRRLPARRLPAARARLRPGARPDRRRRGPAVPPLRARAADARRRPRRSRSPRRWRAWPRELLPLASPIMDRVHQRALQHFVSQDVVGHLETEGAGREPRPPARGDRVRRPRGLHPADRGGRRGGGARRRRALRRGGRGDAARRRARDQDDRRRGDGRRRRPERARGLGGRLPGSSTPGGGRCRASASTAARRCTATATTTAARSTSPRASARARPAARCW